MRRRMRVYRRAPLASSIVVRSAAGRAIGLNTPPVMFADGSLGIGGPYDGIITINSLKPVQFTRPVSPGNFDGQMFTEHEIDEVLGVGSHLNSPRPEYFGTQSTYSAGRASTPAIPARVASVSSRSIADSTTSLNLTKIRTVILETVTATIFARQPVCMCRMPLTATARARIFPQLPRKA